jgi:DNA-binding response OmpR family regulator
MPARILLAEDDRKQAEVIRRYLERDGYDATVVHDGRAAIEAARLREPDLLVLDLMLPAMSGLDVCRTMRAERDVPIIMLTARAGEDDLLLGLAAGADDYLIKPYRPRELLARIHAVLRRAARAARAETERYAIGDLVVDTARHEVRAGGRVVATTPAEFTILACLAAAPGRVFTRQLSNQRQPGPDTY